MIVYVITAGDYSDYHIVGVTQDKKFAEDFCKRRSNEYDEFRVETYNTDDIMAFTSDMHLWRVAVYKGNLMVTPCDDSVYYALAERNEVQKMYRASGVYVFVIAKDAEHAKKIGIDLIMQSRYRKEIEEGGLNGESDIS